MDLPDLPEQHDRVMFARRRAKLTQAKLADRLGVSVRSVQNYESGLHPMPAEHTAHLERLAKLPRGWLVYGGPGSDWDESGQIRIGLIPATLTLGLAFAALAGPAWGTTTKAIFDAPCRACTSFIPGRQNRYKLALSARRRTPPRTKISA